MPWLQQGQGTLQQGESPTKVHLPEGLQHRQEIVPISIPTHRFPRAEPHKDKDMWEGSQELGQAEWWGEKDLARHIQHHGSEQGFCRWKAGWEGFLQQGGQPLRLGGAFGHHFCSPGHGHLEEPICDGHQSHMESRSQHRVSLSACLFPLASTPDQETNQMKLV